MDMLFRFLGHHLRCLGAVHYIADLVWIGRDEINVHSHHLTGVQQMCHSLNSEEPDLLRQRVSYNVESGDAKMV